MTKGINEFKKEYIGSRHAGFDETGFFFIDRKSIADDYAHSEFNANPYGEIAIIDSRQYLIKFTVDELNSRYGDIRRAYNINNIKISPVAVSQVYKPAGTTSVSGTNSSINNISQLYSAVNSYDKEFNAGKTVRKELLNEDGTPRVFYHGTPAENGELTIIDESKAVKRGGLGMRALGKEVLLGNRSYETISVEDASKYIQNLSAATAEAISPVFYLFKILYGKYNKMWYNI